MDLSETLQVYLGDSGWGDVEVSGPAEIGKGWESTIHAFTVTRDGELRDIVLRRYSGPQGAAKAAREYGGMQYLHSAGYPVP